MSAKTIEIDLRRSVTLADVPGLGLAFLSWWGRELIDALPTRLRNVLPRRRREAALIIGRDNWVLINDADEAVEKIDATQADDVLREFASAVAAQLADERLTVLIPHQDALIRRIELPMITDARLRPTIELQLDRLTPFKTENVRFDCRVVERRIEENTMSVDVAVAPSTTIAALEARLDAIGIRPDAIDIGAAGNHVGLGFDLLARQPRQVDRRRRFINWLLALGAAFAWLMAYYAAAAAGEAKIAWWQARIAELRPQAQHGAELAHQIEALSQPLEIARTRTSVTELGILKELTALMPDTGHLFELRVTGESVEFSGFAQNAPALVAKLDASKLFTDVHFRAPVVRRPGNNADRFDMALKIEAARR